MYYLIPGSLLRVFGDPFTPLVEILCSALVSDTLERPNPYSVAERDGNSSLLVRIRVRIFEDNVTSTLTIFPVVETRKSLDYVVTREVAW